MTINNDFGNKAKKLGLKIKLLRIERRLTQAEFAEKIGAEQYQISKWEKGELVISTPYLFRIHEKFGVSLGLFNLLPVMATNT